MVTVNPRVPKHYIKVPKTIILEHSLPEHRISTLIYLNYHQTWEMTVGYSPIHMIQWCGYKANWRTNKKVESENIYEKFTRCMMWFSEHEYIKDFKKELFVQNTLQFSLLNKEKLIPQDNFGLIYDFEIEAIMGYESSYKPLNKSILLLVLSYIRAFSWLRSTFITGHSNKSKQAKPEIFHSQFEKMEKYIGVSARMISRATKVLSDLGIINIYRMPNYKNAEGEWRSNDIIYVFPYKVVADKSKRIRLCTEEEYNWSKELTNGIRFLQESKFQSKSFYQE